MKSSADLADTRWTSATEHKTRAATLKRLAGGLRTQVDGPLGLSEPERKVLQQSIALLEKMAATSLSAIAVAAKTAAKREQRRAAIFAAMRSNFGALDSIVEKVVVVAMTGGRHELLSGQVKTVADLDRAVGEGLDSLAHQLASVDAKDPPTQVAEAWDRFQEQRPALELKYKNIIATIAN